MDQNNERLIPCVFCGALPTVYDKPVSAYSLYIHLAKDGKVYRLRCTEHGCKGQSNRRYEPWSMAVKRWNNRQVMYSAPSLLYKSRKATQAKVIVPYRQYGQLQTLEFEGSKQDMDYLYKKLRSLDHSTVGIVYEVYKTPH